MSTAQYKQLRPCRYPACQEEARLEPLSLTAFLGVMISLQGGVLNHVDESGPAQKHHDHLSEH